MTGRAHLEKLARVLDEYDFRIQTAASVPQALPSLVEGPLIDLDILALMDQLAEAVQELRSVL